MRKDDNDIYEYHLEVISRSAKTGELQKSLRSHYYTLGGLYTQLEHIKKFNAKWEFIIIYQKGKGVIRKWEKTSTGILDLSSKSQPSTE